MKNDGRVILILDPFSISQAQGQRVQGLQEELKAFAEINKLLCANHLLETFVPQTFIISSCSIEHFRTYRGSVEGIEIHTVTPRTIVGERLRCELPPWLTDETINALQLLKYPPPESLINEDWDATIASWLIPGIEQATSLKQWLRIVSSAEDRFDGAYSDGRVSLWIQKQFFDLAVATGDWMSNDYATEQLQSELRQARSPVQFAMKWVKNRAILPLESPSPGGRINIPSIGSQSMSVLDRQLAGRLPLIFQLPNSIKESVGKSFREVLHKLRLGNEKLSDAVKLLNAMWPEVAEQIHTWLEIDPRGLDDSAAQHLSELPGYESDKLIRKLVEQFRPPDNVSAWPDKTDALDSWISHYGKFLRRCFYRRELKEEHDPAIGFGRWLKDNPTMCFEHRRHSYFRVGQAVQDAIAQGRTVFLVIVDALPIHQANDLIGYFSDKLNTQPTKFSYLFSPIPTVTKVCKKAIVTGKLPANCSGDLKSQLQDRYGLSEDEIHIAKSWDGPGQFQVNKEIKLVVYFDNRLDGLLHESTSYKAMVDDSKIIFNKISHLLQRWSEDVQCNTQRPPLILVTSDHGFTFSPTPSAKTMGHRVLDKNNRCVAIDGPIPNAAETDESITVIKKDDFSLSHSYLATSRRYYGHGSASDWVMGHGGLLPEEVIVPFIEWFGDEKATNWPSVNFTEPGYVSNHFFNFSITLKNEEAIPTVACTLTVNITGKDETVEKTLEGFPAGSSTILNFSIPFPDTADSDSVKVAVRLQAEKSSPGTPDYICNDYSIPRKKLLVETTDDQDDFESMF